MIMGLIKEQVKTKDNFEFKDINNKCCRKGLPCNPVILNTLKTQMITGLIKEIKYITK